MQDDKRQSPRPSVLPPDARPPTGRFILAGVAVVALFFGVLLGWAAVAPLESAAVAPGVASVKGESKTIQHLEGGIIRDIRVREGERVTEGQVLVVLEGVEARSELEALASRRISVTAEMARHRAERDGRDAVEFPAWMIEQSGEPAVLSAMQEARALFEARARQHRDTLEVFRHGLAGLESDIKGNEHALAAERRQLALVRERIVKLAPAHAKGLVRQEDMFDLRQEEAQLEGSIGARAASLDTLQSKLQEENAAMQHATSERRSTASQDHAKLLSELAELESRLRTARDVQDRTRIRAPVDGVVMNLMVHTVGGVLVPGAPVMDVVPHDAELVFSAKIRPQDRDAVDVGDRAKIKLDASGGRRSEPALGTVAFVSADRVLAASADEEDYFLARVEIDEVPPDSPLQALHPGMQASVIILTGERTALSYLTEPLSKTFWHAMRER